MSFSFVCDDIEVVTTKKNNKIHVAMIWYYPEVLKTMESCWFLLGPYPYNRCDYNHAISMQGLKIICPFTDLTDVLLGDEYDQFAIHVVTTVGLNLKYLDISSTPFKLDTIRSHYQVPREISDIDECQICMDKIPSIILVTGDKYAHAVCRRCGENMKNNECPFTRKEIIYYLDGERYMSLKRIYRGLGV